MRTCFPLLAALVLLAAGTLRADEKSHRAAAEEMLQACDMEKTMQATLNQVLDVQVKAHPDLLPVKDVLKAFLNKHISYPAVKEDLIRMYTAEFTEAELKEVTAFYRTPTGKKAVQKMPVLMQKGAELGMKRVQENAGELKAMIEAELKKGKD
jgi:hypothetical protein